MFIALASRAPRFNSPSHRRGAPFTNLSPTGTREATRRRRRLLAPGDAHEESPQKLVCIPGHMLLQAFFALPGGFSSEIPILSRASLEAHLGDSEAPPSILCRTMRGNKSGLCAHIANFSRVARHPPKKETFCLGLPALFPFSLPATRKDPYAAEGANSHPIVEATPVCASRGRRCRRATDTLSMPCLDAHADHANGPVVSRTHVRGKLRRR